MSYDFYCGLVSVTKSSRENAMRVYMGVAKN